MWSLFIVLFGGLYWLFKILGESAKKAEIDKTNEERRMLNQMLNRGWHDGTVNRLRTKIQGCLQQGRVSSNGYHDIIELIGDDLLLIFGDINFAEFIERNYNHLSKDNRWYFVQRLLDLALSKVGCVDSTLGINVPIFYGYRYDISWMQIRDSLSYKKRVDLRFCKRIEENLTKFDPRFKMVRRISDHYITDTLEFEYSCSFSDTIRLWNSIPLSPDTAPKPDIEAYLKK